jgi:hypothetical protein
MLIIFNHYRIPRLNDSQKDFYRHENVKQRASAFVVDYDIRPTFLFGMVFYLWWLPRHLFKSNPASAADLP